MRISILGTGLMGAPIARNLARAGHCVRAWNRTQNKAILLKEDGIAIASNIASAVGDAEVLIVMVSTGDAADAVLFASDGAAEHLPPNATTIMMSSIPVEAARRQAERLALRGTGYIDAPVSGGERGAIEGKLTIMAGGDADHIAHLQPVFDPLGHVTHVGQIGCGQLAKLANQAIVGITIGAVAEALLLAERGGADPRAVRKALLGGFADSAILREHGKRMIDGCFEPGAHASTQLKDLRTARRLADECGLALPITGLLETLYDRMCSSDMGRLDHSALYLAMKQSTTASS